MFLAFLLQQCYFATVPTYYYPLVGTISLRVAEKRLVLGRAMYDLYRWGTSISFLYFILPLFSLYGCFIGEPIARARVGRDRSRGSGVLGSTHAPRVGVSGPGAWASGVRHGE